MLGGSSCINFMVYARGHQQDFNQWAADANDTTWDYDHLLPYFKKSEDYNGAYASEPDALMYHGKGGLLNVGTHDFMPGVEDWLAAGVEKGYQVGDYNGATQEVFAKMDVTTQDGWRESTYRAFYQDTDKPPNLCIKKYSHVTKINFEQNRRTGELKAVGVVYHRHNLTRSVQATKEVILSAGTFGSTKLLLLSGIGPAEDLRAVGVPVLKELPVGKNLRDHAYVFVGPFMKGPSLSPNKDHTLKNIVKLFGGMDGPGSAPAGFAGQAFFQSPQAQPPYPDLQAMHLSIALHPELSLLAHNALGLKQEVLDKWWAPFHWRNIDAKFVLLLLGRPKSVGEMRLVSSNPDDDVVLEPNYLQDPDDREALLFGFKKLVDLFENSSSLNAPMFPKPVPGCAGEEFKSDEYFRCVIKHMSGSFYHHVGTNALGKVVDNRLKVMGVGGLRVIDASIMPRPPNGNTQAATIMIGEKGAELIIDDLNALPSKY